MERVYKYTLESNNGFGVQTLEIPSQSILSAESQEEDIVVYALVDLDDLTPIKYEFAVYGTGHDMEIGTGFKFAGTVKMHNGSFMFHVFFRKVG
jgi:hypothetical protein